MKEQSVSLQCTEGNSDKVYNIQLVVAPISGVLWNVNFQYGRRGNTLTSGTKNSTPLAYEAAFKIFNKLVAEKIGKGYISCPETGGELVTMTSNENKSSDTKVRPQLLNDIEPHLLKHFIDDDNFCAQQKFDGMRRLLIKTGEKIVGANSCLLYTSDAADDLPCVDLGGRRIIKKKNGLTTHFQTFGQP